MGMEFRHGACCAVLLHIQYWLSAPSGDTEEVVAWWMLLLVLSLACATGLYLEELHLRHGWLIQAQNRNLQRQVTSLRNEKEKQGQHLVDMRSPLDRLLSFVQVELEPSMSTEQIQSLGKRST